MEKDQATIVACAFLTVVGIGVLAAMPTIQEEMKKRAKIREWERETKACAKNTKDRLLNLLNDPRAKSSDFWSAYDEEMKFLDIMINRPRY